MSKDAVQIPWSEVGTESGRRIVSTSDDLSQKMQDALAGVSGPGIPDFSNRRWKYEFCILNIFWMWYVANSLKLTDAGATKPLLDSYHAACYEAMVRAGLVEGGKHSLRAWQDDVESRLAAYKAAYEQDHTRPDVPMRVTGRDSVGWVFVRYLAYGGEPDRRLVLLVNEFGGLAFQGLAEMFRSLEGQYHRAARSWWKFWQ